ncbi:AraC family transcriptional regulator [Afifella marina]|uniref:Transcriptional regulator, AraC family n=1 Tax=Afifella marina DSM 2698 TaxID=1120955 RepID=A0A1G5MKL6_AFIMA|nr:helix-turn-helix transcriptional regulator [Afifella marina]MBK1623868.1 AraC family transcriptional regulator [Afifella marina DSM 2698]MBK1627216.1 AraC family transcriptional regulator [Afifella marina]MBK5918755.1 AraC family transcriptional regulator [Afifella marina]RAI22636.1 AraC family transcriptional regulator [Afifella marina DSM 2698]SCZ25745.1 transcriptional regulator, AraC family [Afifella marina DSM 2698]
MTQKSTDPADYQVSPQAIVGMPKDYPAGLHIASHSHARAQLIYASAGTMEVATADGLWLVPPQRAVWMPAGIVHEMRARGAVSLRTLFIARDACPPRFPQEPQTVRVSPLLRELILRVVAMPLAETPSEPDRRVLDLVLYEIAWVDDGLPHLPMPRDRRLAAICRALVDRPGDTRSLQEWAAEVGASSRTLARLFKREFGSSFLIWRRQVRALSAIPRLAAGEAVGVVAADLGYETPGAFAAMFRDIMGEKPSRYFDDGTSPAIGSHPALSDPALSDPA